MKLFTVKELAAHSGLPETTIYDLVANGEMAAVRYSLRSTPSRRPRRIRIAIEAYEAWKHRLTCAVKADSESASVPAAGDRSIAHLHGASRYVS